MSRENFLEIIKKQVSEQIDNAYHKAAFEAHTGEKKVNVKKLQGLLQKVLQNSSAQGFPAKEFEELVRSAMPDVAGQLTFSLQPTISVEKKKAA